MASYIALCLLLFFNQTRLIYYPERFISATPQIRNLSFEDIVFTAGDGEKISGWLIPSQSPKGMILFCHGNAGNISHRLDSIEIMHDLGYSVFIFDYRGYGKSEGSPTEEGTYLDVQAAWNFLVNERQISPSDIILFGRSLGGAVAAWLAVRVKPKACIIESTFTSAKDMASGMMPFFPARLLCRFNYDTRKALQKINCPLLIVHSPDDDIIPFRHGRNLFEAAKEPKTFLQINGDHNSGFLLTGKKYITGLENFLLHL